MSRTDRKLIFVLMLCVVVWGIVTLPRDVWINIASVLVGALIALYFSRQATTQLRREADDLRMAADMILVGLSDAELIDARRDPDTRRVFSVRIKDTTLREITEHPETMELIRRLERGEFSRPPRESPETATDEPGKGQGRANTQEPSERRGFWSRLFRGRGRHGARRRTNRKHRSATR